MHQAKRTLEKYGWKEGKGLGKNEAGIVHTIKVPLKTDTSGIGFNPCEDFTKHWWTEKFNQTAKSISVEHRKDGVLVSSTGAQVKLGKRKKSHHDTCKRPPLLYKRFVKAAGEEDSSVAVKPVSSQHPTTVTMLSDTELLEACEGRTAHKGARHGLKQSGKLKRLEEQEKKQMAKSTLGIK